MEIDRRELKRRSIEAIGQTRPRFWIVALVYVLLTIWLPDALDLLVPAGNAIGLDPVQLFLSFFISLFTVVVGFGFRLWALWSVRRMDPGLGALMQGFSVAGRVLLMQLFITLRVTMWMLPVVLLATPLVLALPLPLTSGLMLGISWFIMLRYALAPFLLADRPDDGPSAAIRRSVQLMREWKWELFKLEFSFVGWQLLIELLSTGIMALFLWRGGAFVGVFSGTSVQLWSLWTQVSAASANLAVVALIDLVTLPLLLWLEPYRMAARAGFYDARLRLASQAPVE